jgi:hypothetical protein
MLLTTSVIFLSLYPPCVSLNSFSSHLSHVSSIVNSILSSPSSLPFSSSSSLRPPLQYAGLLVIRAYHASRSEQHRNICLIPTSAHGTNPASAVLAGFKIVVVNCDDKGNIDVADLKVRRRARVFVLSADYVICICVSSILAFHLSSPFNLFTRTGVSSLRACTCPSVSHAPVSHPSLCLAVITRAPSSFSSSHLSLVSSRLVSRSRQAKAALHAKNLAALMVTYPSTHGVFESSIADICANIHSHGGQVWAEGEGVPETCVYIYIYIYDWRMSGEESKGNVEF